MQIIDSCKACFKAFLTLEDTQYEFRTCQPQPTTPEEQSKSYITGCNEIPSDERDLESLLSAFEKPYYSHLSAFDIKGITGRYCFCETDLCNLAGETDLRNLSGRLTPSLLLIFTVGMIYLFCETRIN